MSEAALCFRCDWAGQTRQRECPRCGAPLYRQERDRRPLRLGSRVGGRTDRSVTPVEPSPGAGREEGPPPVAVPPARRNRPGAVLAVVGALLLVALWVLVRPGSREPAPATAPTLTGRIVYASRDGSRLQVLDLAEGTAEPGAELPGQLLSITPVADRPDHVVAVVAGHAGRGVAEAFLVDLGRAGTEPRPIASSPLVAVHPDGGAVVARSSVREDGSCTFVSLPVDGGSRVIGPASRCRGIFALGLSRDEVLFALIDGAGPSIQRLEADGAGTVLEGYGLLAVSPAGDLLAAPTEERRETLLVSPTVLYRPGRGIVDIRRGPDGLITHEVLGWSPDGRLVAVRGRVGRDAGAWVIDTQAGSDPRIPAPVGSRTSSGRIAAAFGRDGLLFLAIEGQLYADSGDRTDPVVMPGGAPTPGGPMAWIP